MSKLTKSASINDVTPGDNEKVATALAHYLADSMNLFQKTLYVHWNVKGGRFHPVHKITEDHYNHIVGSMDDVAERIRMLGYYTPTSDNEMKEFASSNSSIKVPDGEEAYIKDLHDSHMKAVSRIVEYIDIAESQKDTTTADMLSDSRKYHEEAAWMFRSILEK